MVITITIIIIILPLARSVMPWHPNAGSIDSQLSVGGVDGLKGSLGDAGCPSRMPLRGIRLLRPSR